MPVNQGTINRGNGKFAIAYAFQPGENGVRVTYQVPYPSNKATVKLVSANSAERVGLIAPASVQIESAGFTPQGQEQGFNFYSRDSIPAGTSFEVTVSGTAPPPAARSWRGPARRRRRPASIQVLPNRLDSLKWMLLGGFVLLFGLGVFSIWRRPVTAGVDMGAAPAPPSLPAKRKKAAAPASRRAACTGRTDTEPCSFGGSGGAIPLRRWPPSNGRSSRVSTDSRTSSFVWSCAARPEP